jgi:hypothetical protein
MELQDKPFFKVTEMGSRGCFNGVYKFQSAIMITMRKDNDGRKQAIASKFCSFCKISKSETTNISMEK